MVVNPVASIAARAAPERGERCCRDISL